MRGRLVLSDTSAIGQIGELTLGAEAISRGCLVFFPVAGVRGIDLMLLTPSHRRLTIQVKCQATTAFCTIDLKEGPRPPIDVLAVFHADEGWHLMPGGLIGDRRTINVKEVRKYKDNWKILR